MRRVVSVREAPEVGMEDLPEDDHFEGCSYV